MPEPRRIVPDTSALVPAFFPDADSRINRRSSALLAAIQSGAAVAFAPDLLQAEFLKRALRRLDELARASDHRDDATEDVEAQWINFLRTRIIYTPAPQLAATAWDAACRHALPPPDSWFAACARHHDAELWLSHPPADRAGEHGRRYGVDVRYLSAETFGRS